MACYKRIYYIDYCDNEERQANAGFVKLVQWKKKEDISGEGTCLQVYISGFALEGEVIGKAKVLCGIREIPLGQVVINSGKGMAQIVSLEDVLATLEKEGVCGAVSLRVELSADRYFECVLKEAAEVPADEVALEAAEVVDEVVLSEREEVVQVPEESCLQQTYESQECEEVQPQARDKWQQLWAVFPHIHPFEDEREYLKVDLKDMIILPNMCYRVIENSFLLHGYYNYKHLILTKIYKKGRERCYIGVPGNYYEREAQVAVMFGFESFEPKQEPAEEGDFGYYLIGVEI